MRLRGPLGWLVYLSVCLSFIFVCLCLSVCMRVCVYMQTCAGDSQPEISTRCLSYCSALHLNLELSNFVTVRLWLARPWNLPASIFIAPGMQVFTSVPHLFPMVLWF